MAISYIAVSGASTILSFAAFQYWSGFSFDKLQPDGIVNGSLINLENANRYLELLFGSYATTALSVNLILNLFVLLILSLKVIFFVELYPAETRKLVERLINYVIYKGTFLPLVIPPTVFHAGVWSIWLIVLCVLKMFQALARDRLERLNASPSATGWVYFRVYSVLLLVLSGDFLWIRLCLAVYRMFGSAICLLLFFEPFSIAFETLQAMLVHGFQLLDIWLHHISVNSVDCARSKFFDTLASGSLWEWKSKLIRNLGFLLDMATLSTALGHYLYIWWLHGLAFHLVDAVLFLNIRALLSAILKRIRGFIKLRKALGVLHAALPDATSEELQTYDDECAICREPMAKAKRLQCSHLFHLSCLRSWLDQGLNEIYSCPTCRKPFFFSRPEVEANPQSVEGFSDELLARQLSVGLAAGQTLPAGVFPNEVHNSREANPWRNAALDSSWLHTWPSEGVDTAGPSSAMRSVGLGRVQMMMRHLASVGETYAQTSLEDNAWSLWPINPAQATGSGSPVIPPATRERYPGGTDGGLHLQTSPRSIDESIANMLAMAETVREVLPHIPDEMILQDLQRTSSVSITVNNLLQM